MQVEVILKEQSNLGKIGDIVKVADRGNRDFYEVDSVYTSNDADYYANPWDKGHMAPAAAFTDSVENLHETFSYLNCALQRDDLNRGEWAYLETQVREWAKTFGTLEVCVLMCFLTKGTKSCPQEHISLRVF